MEEGVSRPGFRRNRHRRRNAAIGVHTCSGKTRCRVRPGGHTYSPRRPHAPSQTPSEEYRIPYIQRPCRLGHDRQELQGSNEFQRCAQSPGPRFGRKAQAGTGLCTTPWWPYPSVVEGQMEVETPPHKSFYNLSSPNLRQKLSWPERKFAGSRSVKNLLQCRKIK